MNENKRTKTHREKKNPGMREKYAKERKANNAKRPKQHWVDGHWER